MKYTIKNMSELMVKLDKQEITISEYVYHNNRCIAELENKNSARGVCDCPQGSICEFFNIKTENCMYGKDR